MRITQEVEITDVTTRLVQVVCNRCGKEFHRREGDYCWNARVHQFSVSFGYGSGFDGERWAFDLCEDCLLAVIREFRLVPDGFLEPPVRGCPVDRQAAFEHWRATGQWDYLYGLSDEERERLGFVSERERRAFAERFPVCGERIRQVFPDGSEAVVCPLGVSEDGFNLTACRTCDRFRPEPGREIPVVRVQGRGRRRDDESPGR